MAEAARRHYDRRPGRRAIHHCNIVEQSMRMIGRWLQVLGLALPPLAIVLQLTDSVTLGQMLAMLAASVCLFLIGRIAEGYSK
jgi:hypothetical protein